jgi:hypothetical protein
MRESPHVWAAPGLGPDGHLRVADWATENGIPHDRFFDAGPLSRMQIPEVFADCDLAVHAHVAGARMSPVPAS